MKDEHGKTMAKGNRRARGSWFKTGEGLLNRTGPRAVLISKMDRPVRNCPVWKMDRSLRWCTVTRSDGALVATVHAVATDKTDYVRRV